VNNPRGRTFERGFRGRFFSCLSPVISRCPPTNEKSTMMSTEQRGTTMAGAMAMSERYEAGAPTRHKGAHLTQHPK